MSTDIDFLNTSWETFQRVLNHEQQIYIPSRVHISVAPQQQLQYQPSENNFNVVSVSKLPSFQEIFDYSKNTTSSPPSSVSSSEEDSDSTFFEDFFSLENLNTIKVEAMMQDESIPNVEKKKDVRSEIKSFIKKEKEVFEKPKTIEIKLRSNKNNQQPRQQQQQNHQNQDDISSPTIKTNKNKSIFSKDNVLSKASSPNGKKVENVRCIWNNNLQQIFFNNMIPAKRCLYKFENPSNCPWDSMEGLYIFEIHLLQVLCPKEAWNFKRYVDNHSKKTGEGQTFTLCSSIHKDEWEMLEMKSNKFFKKARMININAFKEKNGFITKGKWKYIYSIFQKEFEDCIINTLNVNNASN